MPAIPKPLNKTKARSVLASLYRQDYIQLRDEDGIKSLFLNGEPAAHLFGLTWEDVVEQAAVDFTKHREVND